MQHKPKNNKDDSDEIEQTDDIWNREPPPSTPIQKSLDPEKENRDDE